MNHLFGEIIVGANQPMPTQNPPEVPQPPPVQVEQVQHQAEPKDQGAVGELVRFEDRTDLTPELRAKILAERELATPSTDES